MLFSGTNKEGYVMINPSSDFPENISLVDIPNEYRKVNNVRSLSYFLITTVIIICSGPVAYVLAVWWGYILAYIFVAVAGDALLKLQHDAMHGVLVSDKKLNNILGVFASALMGTRYYDAVTIHMRHHARLGGDDDPNLYWYDEKNNIPIFMLAQLLGAKLWMFISRTTAVFMSSVRPSSEPLKTNTSLDSSPVVVNKSRAIDDLVALGIVHSFLFLGVSFFFAPWVYIVFILLPPSTLGSLLESIRSFSEHARYDKSSGNLADRRRLYFVLSNPLERFFLSQFGFHVHHLHHLYPKVPVFNLPKLHCWMMDNVRGYSELFIMRKSYIGTLYFFMKNCSWRKL
jgi:fatty acid desaturase